MLLTPEDLQAKTTEELEDMLEQYIEMESMSIHDDVNQEMIAIEIEKRYEDEMYDSI